MENEEKLIIPLELEDGTKLPCQAVMVFEALGREYIALLPVELSKEEVLLFRYEKLGDEEIKIEDIADSWEWDRACARFNEVMEEQA